VTIGGQQIAAGLSLTSRLRRLGPDAARLGSFADQGFQGVGNILANAMLARALTHEQFAGIGVMIGVHFLAWGVHRSNVVLPLIVNASEPGAGPDDDDAWWWINLISVGLIAAGLALAWLAFGWIDRAPKDQWLVSAIAWAAVASPWICFVEFARRRLYQHRRGVTAAAASAAGSATLVLAAAIDWRAGLQSPWLGVAGWAMGGAVGVCVATWAAAPGPVAWRTIRSVWRRHQHFALWQTATAIPYTVYTTLVVLMVAAFAGPTAAAAFTAARTLTNPALAVVSAVDTLDKPRAAKAMREGGLIGLRASVRRTLFTIVGLTGPYLALLAIFSGAILGLAFGPAYSHDSLSVSFLALAAFFACLNQAPETNLIVLKASRSMFVVRLGIAAFTLVAMWAGALSLGLLGCASALLAVNLVNFLALRLLASHIERGWRRNAPPAAADPRA
jgi:O-antigen/teichoic acid export membrane protein